MLSYLFPNFLSDEKEFDEAVRYWSSLCDEILSKYGQSGVWELWLNHDPATIDQDDDNFSIYSLISNNRKKGLIIHQQDPKVHTKWEVAAWTKEYERESDEFWASVYLVFNCNLSQKNAEVFREIFDRWVQPDCDKDKIEATITELLG